MSNVAADLLSFSSFNINLQKQVNGAFLFESCIAYLIFVVKFLLWFLFVLLSRLFCFFSRTTK